MNPISNTLVILFLASCATTGTLAQEPTYFPTAFNDTTVEADDAFPTYEPTYPPTTDGTYTPTAGSTSAETETTTSNSTDVEGDDDDQVDDAVDDDLAGVNATSFNDDAILGNETAADDFSDVVNSTDVNVDIVNATDDAIDLGMDDDDNNATVSTTELVTSSPVAAVVIASPTAAPATVEPESDATTAPTYLDSKAMEVTLAPNPAITRDDNGTEEETVDEDGMDDGIRNSTESIFAALSEEANSGMSVMTSSFRSRVTISMVGVGVVSTVAAFIAL